MTSPRGRVGRMLGAGRVRTFSILLVLAVLSIGIGFFPTQTYAEGNTKTPSLRCIIDPILFWLKTPEDCKGLISTLSKYKNGQTSSVSKLLNSDVTSDDAIPAKNQDKNESFDTKPAVLGATTVSTDTSAGAGFVSVQELNARLTALKMEILGTFSKPDISTGVNNGAYFGANVPAPSGIVTPANVSFFSQGSYSKAEGGVSSYDLTTAISDLSSTITNGSTTLNNSLIVNGTLNGTSRLAGQVLVGGASSTSYTWSTDTGQVAHLPLNDNAASPTITGTSGGNSATLINLDGSSNSSSNTGSGKINSAIYFNGSTTLSMSASETNFDFEYDEAFSISVWVKATSSAGLMGLFGKLNTSGDWKGYYSFIDGTTGYTTFVIQSDNSPNYFSGITANINILDGNWHQLTFVKNELPGFGDSASLKIYIDGVDSVASSISNTFFSAGSGSSMLNNNNLIFGSRGETQFVARYKGFMDDIRVFSRAVTAGEITAIYNSGSGTEDNPSGTFDNVFNVISTQSVYESSRGLDALDDLAILGRLEVDSDAYLDKSLLVGDSLLFVDSVTRNVGIGTLNPSKKLSVQGAGTFEVENDETMQLTRNTLSNSYAGGYGNLRLIQKHTPGYAINNGWGTGITFTLMDRDDNLISNTGSIYSHFENVLDSGDPTYMTFSTKPTGSGEAERLRITSTGNIGIGTSTPGARLSVEGTALVRGRLFIDGTGASGAVGDSVIYMSRPNTTKGVFQSFKTGSITTTPTTPEWLFGMLGSSNNFSVSTWDGSSQSERLTLQASTANLGIASTSPGARLVVKGSGTGTGFTFQTTNSSNVPHFTVLDNGNVGIGTTTPSAQLSLVSGAGTGIDLSSANRYVSIETSTGYGELRFTRDSGVNARIQAPGGTSMNISTLWGGNEVSKIDLQRGSNAGYIVFSTGSSGVTERMRIDATGNIGIGTTTPGQLLTVAGTIQSTSLLGGATTLSTDANGNIIRTPSDQKLKTNVETLTSSLDKVKQLRGVSYKWIDEARFGSSSEIGLIAQEVQAVVPEVVKDGGDYLSVNYQNLVALLIEAIKELAGKIERITAWFVGDSVFKVGEDATLQLDGKAEINGQICVENVCATKEQFKQLLINAGGQTLTPAPASIPSDPTPESDTDVSTASNMESQEQSLETGLEADNSTDANVNTDINIDETSESDEVVANNETTEGNSQEEADNAVATESAAEAGTE